MPINPTPHEALPRTGLRLVDDYLRQLPAGLASYPQVQQKGSVYDVFMKGVPLVRFAERLPPALRALVEQPPRPSDWLHEVTVMAMYLASAELCFENPNRYVEHAYLANRRLMESTEYALLFRGLGPEQVITGIASRWSALHRGTNVTHVEYSGRTVTFSMHVPPHEVPELIARCYGTSARAAIEVAGVESVTVDTQVRSPEHIEFLCRW